MVQSGIYNDNEFALLFVEVHAPKGFQLDDSGDDGAGPLKYIAAGYGMEVPDGLGNDCDDPEDGGADEDDSYPEVVSMDYVKPPQPRIRLGPNASKFDEPCDEAHSPKPVASSSDDFIDPAPEMKADDGWWLMSAQPTHAAPMQGPK